MAMTLSAVMNLNGNFAAQIQKNAQAMQGIAQQAQSTGKSIRQAFSDSAIGKGLTQGLAQAKDAMGAAGIASLGFLKSSVDAAAKSQKINSDLAQTIKSTGGAAGMTADEVSKMASEMSKTNLASAGMIKQGDNMLLTFTNIGKDVFPQASQAMVDMAQKMGGDPVNSAIQLGKAINDPTTGLTALTRVGVTFDAQQQQQIKTMQAAGDMAGAQKVILNELNKEFGGQGAAALNTYDGQMQKFIQTIGGIKGAIGGVLLPYLTQIAQKLNSGAQAVSDFAQQHKTLIAVILSVTGALGTLIGGASLFNHLLLFLPQPIKDIIEYLKQLPIPIGVIIGAIGLLVAAYTTNFMGFRDAVDSFVKPIITAFTNAIDVFKNTHDVLAAFSTFLNGVFGNETGGKITACIVNMKTMIMSLIEIIKSHMPEIKATIQSVFEGVVNIWNSILKPVLGTLIQTILDVVNWIIQNWPQISAVINNVFSGISNVWSNVLKPVLGFIIVAFGQVVSWVVSNWPVIESIIATVMNVVLSVITSVISVIKSVWSAIGPTIIGAINRIVSFFSSALPHLLTIVKVVFIGIMAFIGPILVQVYMIIMGALGFIKGIWSSAWSLIGTTLKFYWDYITGIISIAWDVISGIIKVALDLLSGNFKEAGSDFLDIFRNLWDDIKNMFSNLATDAVNWGKDFVQGLIDGIKGAIGGVVDAVTGVADTIKSYLHFSVPDVGPLTDYESWMPDFMGGLSNGIKVNTHLVTEPIKDLSVGIKTNALNGLSGGVAKIQSQSASSNNKSSNSKAIHIAKLADHIIVREEADIDKIATQLANKLVQTELGMA